MSSAKLGCTNATYGQFYTIDHCNMDRFEACLCVLTFLARHVVMTLHITSEI